MNSVIFSLVSASLLVSVTSFRYFRARIPNGLSVPHPCQPDTIWEGVGHYLVLGTGVRNPFGLDFQAVGEVWTVDLCRKDSDGDGKSNGQELGDPNCVWVTGATPERTVDISHPGICDPWDSPTCLSKPLSHAIYKTQGDWMRDVCKSGDFVCDGLNDTDTRNLTLQLPIRTAVPPQETSYICQIFDLDTIIPPGDYHLIAVEPVIVNKDVLHHMVLFGCDDALKNFNTEPFQCGMTASSSCQEFLSVWTVGLAGECFHPSTGIRLGVNGYKRVAVQLHWNNPMSATNLTDGSGLKLHYTTKRRPYDSGILITGAEYFWLDPKRESITITSTCTQMCTETSFQGSINVTSAWNHMHYAGRQMSIQVFRNQTFLTNLTNEIAYNYDSPQVKTFTDNPLPLYPGDELITRCTYNTMNRDKTTFWGEATSDEMCFGFLRYYPMQNLRERQCLSGGPDFSFCDRSQWASKGCANVFLFASEQYLLTSPFYQELVQKCKPFGPCVDECSDLVLSEKLSNTCLQGETFDFIKAYLLISTEPGREFMARFSSCEVDVNEIINPPTARTTLYDDRSTTSRQTTATTTTTTTDDGISYDAATSRDVVSMVTIALVTTLASVLLL